MTQPRRQALIMLILAVLTVLGIILISRLYAGERDLYEIDVIGGGLQGVGSHPYGPLAVPPGMGRVGVRVNRAAFSRPEAEVSVTMEALIRGEWVLLLETPRTAGGLRLVNGKPQPFSTAYMDLPADATEIRGMLSVFGSPANVPTQLVFE